MAYLIERNKMANKGRKLVNTEIPGLTIEWKEISGKLYANLIHIDSNLKVIQFTNAPLPFGKKEFIRRLDSSAFAFVDWTRAAVELARPETAMLAMEVKKEILNAA